MEMIYDGALVMPRNFVKMDEKEMTYLEGGGIGKHWYNKRSFVATVLDVGIALFIGIGGILNAVKAKQYLAKIAGKTVRLYMINRLKKYIGSAIANFFATALNVISAIGGFTLGGLIAYGMDRLDGKNDGYVLA